MRARFKWPQSKGISVVDFVIFILWYLIGLHGQISQKQNGTKRIEMKRYEAISCAMHCTDTSANSRDFIDTSVRKQIWKMNMFVYAMQWLVKRLVLLAVCYTARYIDCMYN